MANCLKIPALVSGLLVLASCGDGTGGGNSLLSSALGSGTGPNEFLVVPQKPLEMPDDLSTLPAPNPGAKSRVELNPLADASLALGGNGQTFPEGQMTASEAALIKQVGPRDPDIRQKTANEPLRKAYRTPLNKLIYPNDQYENYFPYILDAEAEFVRLRELGVKVPPAPVGFPK